MCFDHVSPVHVQFQGVEHDFYNLNRLAFTNKQFFYQQEAHLTTLETF